MASQKHPEAGSIPGIALRLEADASDRQTANPDYIAGLIRDADSDLQLEPHISPLLPQDDSIDMVELENRAAALNPSYQKVNFDTWYQIHFEHSERAAQFGLSDDLVVHPRLVQLISSLQAHPSVLHVHFLQAGPPPVDPSQNPLSTTQSYLNAAPVGIDSAAAWAVQGGDGFNINIIDIEQGWNLNHEDLVAAGIALYSGTNKAYFDHGTSVLGEMLMVDNKLGGIGIAPSAKGRVVSQWNGTSYSTPLAIRTAIGASQSGDFILLEAQEFDPVSGSYYWPVEIADANFQLLLLALSLGIIVLEPACNGNYNLDTYTSSTGKYIFNRASSGFRDSGAIMVGAASSTVPHSRMGFSNYGSRVDLYGWGENVVSTNTNADGTSNNMYTNTFSGTSSATPIIAGAAMAVQGTVFAKLKKKLLPSVMRTLLTTGATNSANPTTDKIGVMPNLKAIMQGSVLQVYLAAAAAITETEAPTTGAQKISALGSKVEVKS